MRVDVVMVTYGNRWKYVERILEEISSYPEITNVVLVNNGVSYNIVERVKSYKKVIMIDFTENKGSAYGFHEGIKKSMELEGEYFWLLDDDNLPNHDSLKELFKAKEKLNDQRAIFTSLREDRYELLERKGQSYEKNSFFEFHIRKKIFKNKKENKKLINSNLICCETVPYGGLLVDKLIMNEFKLPNKNYFLYCDDNDFTYQFTNKEYKIYCVIDSKIKDLESSWYRKEKVPMFKGLFQSKELNRAYYTIRNRVFFERKYIVNSLLVYYFNLLIYLIYVFIIYMPKNKEGLNKFRLILNAINDGNKGKLGEINF